MQATSSTHRPALSPAVGVDGFACCAELDAVRACIAGLAEKLASAAGGRDVDAARVAVIRALEDVKSLCCAVQGELAVALDSSQRQRQADAGLPESLQGRGVAAQVALACREPPQSRERSHMA